MAFTTYICIKRLFYAFLQIMLPLLVTIYLLSMKKLLAGIIVFALSITFVWPHTNKQSTRHSWVLTITPLSSKHYLDSIATAWKKDNIVLKFSKLQYKANGKLIQVRGSIVVNGKGEVFGSDKLETIKIRVTDTIC
jgi:hypothetical protein